MAGEVDLTTDDDEIAGAHGALEPGEEHIPSGFLNNVLEEFSAPRVDLATALGLRKPSATALPPLPRRL